MGKDKATLPVGNRPLIAHVHDVVRQIFPDVVIISRYHQAIEGVDAPIFKDALPWSGSLIGIVSALLYSEADYVFIFGCDMPFLRKDTITEMVDLIRGEDIVIPRTPAGYEPLHAIYSRACLPHFLRAIDRGNISISKVFPFLSVTLVERPALFVNGAISIFTNINTEEDLEFAERFIGERNHNGNEGVRH